MQQESQNVTALRTAVKILKKWQASEEQIEAVLKVSESIYKGENQDDESATDLDKNQLQRISMVLNIHAALRTVFENPKNLYAFPSMKNDNTFFNGKTPLEVMSQGGLADLQGTLNSIESLKNAAW
ncbi:DUF2384 domain-containing protein [Pseudomonas sp. WS 5532]|uniref:hypothetical protein n=1 Tax=Pseudomonas sp. WS 5532 TaxID=2717495 RepID=UPI001472E824|nr:hypothetical protein [Pseudomonas sp. WS 5532]NMX72802.1 DUF2384 domain-containing protein [Pseudomonas sp. WS 5532]NMX74308.1 DUF2384 domain-containing protein [Pseudomonas sp. WS 5532]